MVLVITLAAVNVWKSGVDPNTQIGNEPAHLGQYSPREYTPAETEAMIASGPSAVVLDVRSAEEYQAGHVPGAINIPYDDIEALSRVSHDQEVIVYCTQSSWRAPYAAYSLYKAGHPQVSILQGGAFAWEHEGYVVEPVGDEGGRIVPKPAGLVADSPTQVTPAAADRPFTEEILGYYDGREGRPAYVAVEGVVYDVTESPLWQNGVHRPALMAGFLEVKAGRDLTSWLKFSPHGKKNLEKFPVVGVLE